MVATLIILRGNSASGKTTLAAQLETRLPAGQTLVLHQDTLRRELLHASDHQGTLAVPLIETLAEFGRVHYRYTIIEGILRKDVYGEMLTRVKASFAPHAWSYYLTLPFEQTLARDATKPQPFGEETLRRWWRDQDQLSEDHILDAHSVAGLADQITQEVIKDE